MEFKAGQLVKSPTFIGAILKVGKEVNGKFSARSFPKPGYLSSAVDNWDALTRAEIIQHMVDNGWEEPKHQAALTKATEGCISIVFVKKGTWVAEAVPNISRQNIESNNNSISLQQEAYNYSQALNLAPNE